MNKAVSKLNSSMLVGVKSGCNLIKCILVPTEAKALLTKVVDSKLHLQYSLHSRVESIDLKMTPPDIPSVVWVIVKSFKVVIAGDLSFFATAMGRDGHSNCRCPYCDITPST